MHTRPVAAAASELRATPFPGELLKNSEVRKMLVISAGGAPQGQRSPGRAPSLRSGGWGVALWLAAAALLPSRVGFPPQLVVRFTRPLSFLWSPRYQVIASGSTSFCFPLFNYTLSTW